MNTENKMDCKKVIDLVLDKYDISLPQLLKTDTRTTGTVEKAKHTAVVLLTYHLGIEDPNEGAFILNKKRSSVISSLQRADYLYKTNLKFRKAMQEIVNQLQTF